MIHVSGQLTPYCAASQGCGGRAVGWIEIQEKGGIGFTAQDNIDRSCLVAAGSFGPPP
jgi:hypothetical protein